MGNSISCVPQHRKLGSWRSRRNSSKRKSSRKETSNGPDKSTSLLNMFFIPPTNMTEMNAALLQNWEPFMEWRKNAANAKNLGETVYYSKVRFKFQHCQDVNDCYLELFQTHLRLISVNTNGLAYQETLPLKDMSVSKLESETNNMEKSHVFKITGQFFNPIIIYCVSEQELQAWHQHLEKLIELNRINGGSYKGQISSEAMKNKKNETEEKEALRRSVQKDPIQDWEGSQRESLGSVVWVTTVKLQHLPFEVQHDRLLILYTDTLIILAEEDNKLHFRGELPFNAISVTSEDGDRKENTFTIEGRMINPIKVTCQNSTDYDECLYYLKRAGVTVSGTSSGKTECNASCSSSSGSGRSAVVNKSYDSMIIEIPSSYLHGLSQPVSEVERRSFAFHENHKEEPFSPGYSEPLHVNRCSDQSQLSQSLHSALYHGCPQGKMQPTPLSPIYNEPYISGTQASPILSVHTSVQHHAPSSSLEKMGNSFNSEDSSSTALYATPPKRKSPSMKSKNTKDLPKATKYSEPSDSLKLLPGAPMSNCHLMNVHSYKEENYLHHRNDRSSSYDMVLQVLDSYKEGQTEDSSLCLDSSFHTYEELDSIHGNRDDDGIWDFDLKEQRFPHIAHVPTHRTFCYQDGHEAKGKTTSNRWS
ncbi:pleckstrin homology domain-containing family N member 1 isoform X2 [Protopterus annectens]|uniref:pleckstrin homology domain-containing family N member 1 isoform X2 n=1 Tax=Protopterus annectens TaxID=7888 RepID=UPI001CFA27A0|nr:pleckstrin homology domain-containing family N member 1 isoform X2 [Protopterus annectens]